MDTRIMDQISTCFNLYNSSGIRFGQAKHHHNMQTNTKPNMHKQVKQQLNKTTPDMQEVKEQLTIMQVSLVDLQLIIPI